MSQELTHISVRNPVVKALLVLFLLVAAAWSYFVVRWYLGNTLAEYFNPGESNLSVAQMAVSMAPDDPLTHWRVAQVSQKTLPLDQQTQAIVEYEKAVNLSPNDYRFWMSLGIALEQTGEVAQAEQALNRAVVLAPAYAYPRWYLGNLLLRDGRYEDAFTQLRLAAEADPELQPQQFNLIWEIYQDDPAALQNAVGQDIGARARFALYLLSQKHFAEGLGLWNGMTVDEKKENKETGHSIIATLKSDVRFHDALNVWNDLVSEKNRAEIGHILDGSFEEGLSSGAEALFDWQVQGAPQMQIGIDPNKSHGGARSLRLLFQVRANLETMNVSQLIPVMPQTEYEFECFVRTDKLETGSAPQLQITDATNGTGLASSPQAPGGSNDWSPIKLSFKTGEKTEGITLRIVRTSCSNEETPVCPIFGSVWYDDFSLRRRN